MSSTAPNGHVTTAHIKVSWAPPGPRVQRREVLTTEVHNVDSLSGDIAKAVGIRRLRIRTTHDLSRVSSSRDCEGIGPRDAHSDVGIIVNDTPTPGAVAVRRPWIAEASPVPS